ncbi:hypothetical protein SAMN05446037_101053 [Anaerovirgula multivorans]|uniref:Uncharacterized protein n=1 Tax=Anaerovirgula multivorans TaxID=312168 RepID=A0A239EJ39_9FIRM|nr:hypothetical protein [Anaerovirgula multivorans]SNS44411.1 hypothetical protein SAMN05446037_101053 [Anaerovirgula multivorans]
MDELVKEQLTALFGDAQYISMTSEEIMSFISPFMEKIAKTYAGNLSPCPS